MVLPPALAHGRETYETYYRELFEGRKLTWAHHYGTVVMVGQFTKKAVTLTVTTAQAVILNLFNGLDSGTTARGGGGGDEGGVDEGDEGDGGDGGDGGGEQKKALVKGTTLKGRLQRGVTFEEIKAAVGLDDRQCKVLLHSLSCIKKRKVRRVSRCPSLMPVIHSIHSCIVSY
jgi:hypothetical protein